MLKLISWSDDKNYFKIRNDIVETEDGQKIKGSIISTKTIENSNTGNDFSRNLIVIKDNGQFADTLDNNNEYIAYNNKPGMESITLIEDIKFSISSYLKDDRSPSNLINVVNSNNPNSMGVIAIAIPFTGSMQNIPYDPNYRILKALIAKVDDTLRLLYMVLSINYDIFNSTHKFYKEEINIDFNTYNFKNKEMVYRSLKITKKDTKLSTLYVNDVYRSPFRNISGTPLWILYDSDDMRNAIANKNDEKKDYKSNQKRSTEYSYNITYKDYSDREYEEQYRVGSTKKKGPRKKKKKIRR